MITTRFVPRSTAPRLALAVGTAAMGLALLMPSVQAAEGELTEEMAATIQRTISQVPSSDGGTPNVSVRIVDGKYVVSGLADGMSARQDVINALRGIEGLDWDLLENNVVVQ